MNGLTRVTQRINTIEKRFMVPANQAPIGAFADVLAGAQQNSLPTVLNANQQNVVKLVEFSANQYGVDPRLALAVAKTESGLATDSISSAGAVGVMQLMPDTARSLGVRNINDPRENIDGGVRYLRQMLNTFNGDVVKAVAAYNAGPEAVKNYGGIPPYAETKSYVARVMSQIKE
ncbi:Membrane-bound lytic murein transglycosylase F [bioreactor metagenome]|uniref:Membrane-bound lytic murein transglycosylase F n=1 Tax=bioreactor metagenome TaxID=1076179 RepID=A0A644XWM8_9ZZZZ